MQSIEPTVKTRRRTQTLPASEALVETEPTMPPMPSEPLAKEPFQIDSDDAADWLLSKLAALDAEASLLQCQHEERMKRIATDRQGLENLFGHQLETYVRRCIAADKRGRKSILFAHGTCSLRTVAAGVKIADTQAAMEFARQSRPETVRTVETLDLTAYRSWANQRLLMDGELLPGVEYCGERESFSVRFAGRKEE